MSIIDLQMAIGPLKVQICQRLCHIGLHPQLHPIMVGFLCIAFFCHKQDVLHHEGFQMTVDQVERIPQGLNDDVQVFEILNLMQRGQAPFQRIMAIVVAARCANRPVKPLLQVGFP
mgnify:CR=1 FL=1